MSCKYKNYKPPRRKSKVKSKRGKSKVKSKRRKSKVKSKRRKSKVKSKRRKSKVTSRRSKFSKESNTLSVKTLRSARDLIPGSLHDVFSVNVQSILNTSPMTWNELIQILKNLSYFYVSSLPPTEFRPQTILGYNKAISEENLELLRRAILRGILRGVVSMSFAYLTDRANIGYTLIETIYPLLTPSNFPILRQLDISSAQILILPHFPNLIDLYINDNPGISVENFSSSLNILECNGCNFHDLAFSIALTPAIHLTKLHAGGNLLDILTAHVINGLPALTDLNLSDNTLDDDATQVLFGNKVSKLIKLDLNYNVELTFLINPATTTIMSGLVNISELNLSFTTLTPRTIIAIFSQLHQLIKLLLDNMPFITNYILREIIGLNLSKTLPNLKYLSLLEMIAPEDVNNNLIEEFREEFAQEFAKKLPHTKVYLSYMSMNQWGAIEF